MLVPPADEAGGQAFLRPSPVFNHRLFDPEWILHLAPLLSLPPSAALVLFTPALLILALPPGLIREGTGQQIRAAQAADTSHLLHRRHPVGRVDRISAAKLSWQKEGKEYLFAGSMG